MVHGVAVGASRAVVVGIGVGVAASEGATVATSGVAVDAWVDAAAEEGDEPGAVTAAAPPQAAMPRLANMEIKSRRDGTSQCPICPRGTSSDARDNRDLRRRESGGFKLEARPTTLTSTAAPSAYADRSFPGTCQVGS